MFADVHTVLFDLGSTLLDFERPEGLPEVRAAIGETHAFLLERHAPPALPRYRRKVFAYLLWHYVLSRLRGRELDTMARLRELHARMGMTLGGEEEAAMGRRFFAPVKPLSRTPADAVEALALLKRRGYALGIISNTIAPPTGLDEHLEEQGIKQFFPVRVYSCDVGVAKPHRRIFAVALQAMAVDPRRCIYVGDKPRIDVKGAHRVGMRAVLRAPAGRPVLRGPRADAVIQEIRELPALLPQVAPVVPVPPA